MDEMILSVKDLHVSFNTKRGKVHALRGVNFDIKAGETLAIVGESGSGKSVTTEAIMGLLPGNAQIDSGEIIFSGNQLVGASEETFEGIRGSDITMIFQDPMTALDPTMTIGNQLIEPLMLHRKVSKEVALKKAGQLLTEIGIPDSQKSLQAYPHQFSGGMRQRIVIAIALITQPKIMIADEPTTALDVTIQAQILEVMHKLQKQLGTAIIFITHDLGVVSNIADRVAVMYAGEMIEVGTKEDVFLNPQHPYTWGLLASMPSVQSKMKRLHTIPGTPPDLLHEPIGDAFAPRNPFALEVDLIARPPMFVVSGTHQAATWLLDKRAPKITPPAEITRRWQEFKSRQEILTHG